MGRARSPKAKAKPAKVKTKRAAPPKQLASKAASHAKPKSKSKPGKLSALGARRGAALVDNVIEEIEKHGGVLSGCGEPDHRAKGMSAGALAKLKLPNGKPLPPSLATFLAYDETYLGILGKGKLLFRSFTEMMRAAFDDETAMMFADYERFLPGRCLALPEGADSLRFMYVGEPDEYGEYPVFIADTDELPWVGLAYPGVDVYLADGAITTVIKSDYMDGWRHKIYAPMLASHARRNFAGFKAIDFQDPEHLDGPEAAQAGMAPLLGHAPSAEDLVEFS